MAERRRLPILSNDPPPAAADDDDAPRPAWHWVGFGTVAIFAAWLPLATLGASVSARVMAARFGADASKDAIELALHAMTAGERARLMATVALPSVVALALGAFGGGFVVGRFGSGTGMRESARAGAITALIASALAWAGPTWSTVVSILVIGVVAVAFAAWGGRVGASRRPAA